MSHVKVNLFIMPSPAKTVGRPEPRGHWPGLAWLGAWWRQNTDGNVLFGVCRVMWSVLVGDMSQNKIRAAKLQEMQMLMGVWGLWGSNCCHVACIALDMIYVTFYIMAPNKLTDKLTNERTNGGEAQGYFCI